MGMGNEREKERVARRILDWVEVTSLRGRKRSRIAMDLLRLSQSDPELAAKRLDDINRGHGDPYEFSPESRGRSCGGSSHT